MTTRANVPCGDCHACCHRDFIPLVSGDRPELYETVSDVHPFTGRPCLMLAKTPEGSCIYLGDGGCTIHDHAPTVCRVFDCRRMYLQTPRSERRRMLRAGVADREVFDAGRARVGTLPPELVP